MTAAAEKMRGLESPTTNGDSVSAGAWPSPAVWAAARALIAPHRGRLALGFALMLANRLCALVLPFTARTFIAAAEAGHVTDVLGRLAAMLAAATLVGGLTTFAVSQVLGVAAARAVADLRVALMARVVRWPIARLDRTSIGELLTRIVVDAEGIRPLVGRDLVQVAAAAVSALIALVALVSINARLTLAVSGGLALFAAAVALASARLRPLFRDRSRMIAATTGRLSAALSGIRIVKAYAAEAREDEAFAQRADMLLDNVRQTTTGASALTSLSTAMIGVTAIVIMLVGGHEVRTGQMRPADVASYVSFLAMLALPVVQMASLATPMAEGFAALERLEALRTTATEDDGDSAGGLLSDGPAGRGDVEFEDVSFAYEPGVPVLSGVSLHVPAGATVALVGPSGAGKTTLLGLLMALHRPTHGRVLVDGVDLATVPTAALRRHLGVVLQDDFLFDGTIADNIAFSRPDAAPAAIEQAGAAAHCDEFVTTLADGYNTVIGERGVRLSGGQRQRVSIARAILADPAILLLDEATSSLDSEAETHVQMALTSLRRGRTTLAIAHRLSTIVSADEIVVLERGRIIERGTHAALLARQGRYHQMCVCQYASLDDQLPVAHGGPLVDGATV